MNTTIGAKLWLSFLAILTILLVVGSASYLSTAKLTETAQLVSRTLEVQGRLKDLMNAMDDMQIAQRGYVITGEDSYLEPYHAARDQLDGILRGLKELTADSAEQQRRLEHIGPVISARVAYTGEIVELRRTKGFEPARKLMVTGKGKKLTDELQAIGREIEDQEVSLLKRRQEDARAGAESAVLTIIGGVLVAAALVAGAGIFLTRHIARPLQEVTEVAERITAGELATDLSPGNRKDEIGTLMQAFVRMAESLQAKSRLAEQIAAGNLGAQAVPDSPRDVLGNALAAMVESLRAKALLAEQIAGGDLSAQIAPQSPQDVLGNALAAMVASLRKMTQEIGEGINVLAASASEIVASTTQVASSSAETATAVSQTMATVEEVKQTSQLAAEKARQVSESAQRTVEISKSGRKSVDESVESMHRIQEQMESIAESIVRL
ncbi:CHASE3 domain-containing protein, partial [Denitratisoma oestradiolicum]